MTMTKLFEDVDKLCEIGTVDSKLYVDIIRSEWVDGIFTQIDVAECDGMLQFYDKVMHKGLAAHDVADMEMLHNPSTGKIDYLTIYLA